MMRSADQGTRVLMGCSACAGDYEDPDRTAPDDESGDADSYADAEEEFPEPRHSGREGGDDDAE